MITERRDELDAKVSAFAPGVCHWYFETVDWGKHSDPENHPWIVKHPGLDHVICEGPARFVRRFAGWEDAYPLSNPTIKDAICAMQRSIETIPDRHHVFFEGLEIGEPDAYGIRPVEIITGS